MFELCTKDAQTAEAVESKAAQLKREHASVVSSLKAEYASAVADLKKVRSPPPGGLALQRCTER